MKVRNCLSTFILIFCISIQVSAQSVTSDDMVKLKEAYRSQGIAAVTLLAVQGLQNAPEYSNLLVSIKALDNVGIPRNLESDEGMQLAHLMIPITTARMQMLPGLVLAGTISQSEADEQTMRGAMTISELRQNIQLFEEGQKDLQMAKDNNRLINTVGERSHQYNLTISGEGAIRSIGHMQDLMEQLDKIEKRFSEE